jgi:L-amino acid N-acyltransferase YncA
MPADGKAPRALARGGARAADFAAIADIYGFHVLHGLASFELEPPSAEEMARRHAAITARPLPYLVAELDGGVAGYAYAAPYRARPAYCYTVEDSVYVHRDCGGRGIGGRLLAELIARCEAAGCRQMVAVIGDSANGPSIRLHEKFSFARVGLLPAVGYKFGRWVDSVLMQRALGAGSAALPGKNLAHTPGCR